MQFVYKILVSFLIFCGFSGSKSFAADYPGKNKFFEGELSDLKVPKQNLETVFDEYQERNQPAALVKSPADLVAVFSFSQNTDQLYTRNRQEGLGANYQEQATYQFLRHPDPRAHAIYRCLRTDPFSHFISTNPSCEGHSPEGLLGYVFSQAYSETRPFFLCRSENRFMATDIRIACTSQGLNSITEIGHLPPN